MTSLKSKKIGVLGLWHLGSVYTACLAKQGFDVVGFDLKKSVIESLSLGIPPIFEPDLEQLIKSNLNKNLHFTSISEDAISDKDYVFITIDTPVNNQDKVQLKVVYDLFNLIKKYISPKTVLIISSQIPVGTCRVLQNQFKKLGKRIPIIYFPENLRLGQAIQTFSKPDRIIIGADDEKIRSQFTKDFTFFNCPVLEMNIESAEMSKHAMNAYLATMISFSSEISDFCEYTGADALEVMRSLKADARVSPGAPLGSGIGFAGGTLGRDLQTLKMLAKKQNYNPQLVKAVYSVNQSRLPRLLKTIKKTMGTVKNKKIGLLGLTYKPGTDTLRRSQSLELASMLKDQGAIIRAIDPAIKKEIKNYEFISVVKNQDELFENLDAVILMTWWDEFKALDPKVSACLMKNKIIFDTRNFLDKKRYEKDGFLYIGIGQGKI